MTVTLPAVHGVCTIDQKYQTVFWTFDLGSSDSQQKRNLTRVFPFYHGLRGTSYSQFI